MSLAHLLTGPHTFEEILVAAKQSFRLESVGSAKFGILGGWKNTVSEDSPLKDLVIWHSEPARLGDVEIVS